MWKLIHGQSFDDGALFSYSLNSTQLQPLIDSHLMPWVRTKKKISKCCKACYKYSLHKNPISLICTYILISVKQLKTLMNGRSPWKTCELIKCHVHQNLVQLTYSKMNGIKMPLVLLNMEYDFVAWCKSINDCHYGHIRCMKCRYCPLTQLTLLGLISIRLKMS